MNQYTEEELNNVVSAIAASSYYAGYKYDEEIGFHKGPCSLMGFAREPIELKEDQAVIGLKQPITRMAQHHLLLIRNKNNSWTLERLIAIVERA